MVMRVAAALAYLSCHSDPSDPTYLAACKVVADNRAELQYRVFIHLPGGLDGNTDPAWSAVKEASEELCSCGNERVFEPFDMRHEFKASAADPIVMELGDELYVRPVGAPASVAYVRLEVADTPKGVGLIIWSDPMSASIDPVTLLAGPPGYRLSQIEEILSLQDDDPLVLMRDLEHVKKVPILAILATDPEANTVTVLLDAGVEQFDPHAQKVHTH